MIDEGKKSISIIVLNLFQFKIRYYPEWLAQGRTAAKGRVPEMVTAALEEADGGILLQLDSKPMSFHFIPSGPTVGAQAGEGRSHREPIQGKLEVRQGSRLVLSMGVQQDAGQRVKIRADKYVSGEWEGLILKLKRETEWLED